MASSVIHVEGVWKEYQIGAPQRHTTNFREAFVETLAAPFQRWRGKADPETRKMWALQDITFEVKAGEVLGIVGANGAGKSTLLKILSRITEPTRGQVRIAGRISSLLEVGTGFHPELTGRENVFLNGAILGMSRREIQHKLEEILVFAEVEEFADTPVKHYSSGMYMRLAFSVAAHLDPEILIVDEVLAVGDASFQQKSLSVIERIAKSGRTVLLVTHTLPTVSHLCDHAICLEKGKIVDQGEADDVVRKYLRKAGKLGMEEHLGSKVVWPTLEHAPGDDIAKLKSVTIVSSDSSEVRSDIRKPLTIQVEYWLLKPYPTMVGVAFYDSFGTQLFTSLNLGAPADRQHPKEAGLYQATCTVPGNLLSEGEVKVWASVFSDSPHYKNHALQPEPISIEIVDSGAPGSVRAGWHGRLLGAVRPQLDWGNHLIRK